MEAVPKKSLGPVPDYEPGSAPRLRLVTDHPTPTIPSSKSPPAPVPRSMVWPPLAAPSTHGSTATGGAPTGHPPDTGVPLHPARIWQTLRQVLEVLDGRRPTEQLAALLPPDDYAALTHRRRTPGRRHLLRRVHACYPTQAAVEVAAVVVVLAPAGEEEVRAAVARFERTTDRWRCTVLRMV
jgi:hypothetical protein